MFDEADSLLLDRVDAVRSWEISQVNEMLTWMEQHTLPFACTTNLPDRLDRASLRRFLVKVRFDWLTQAQARLAFRRFFGLTAPAALDGLRDVDAGGFCAGAPPCGDGRGGGGRGVGAAAGGRMRGTDRRPAAGGIRGRGAG